MKFYFPLIRVQTVLINECLTLREFLKYSDKCELTTCNLALSLKLKDIVSC